MPRPRGFRYTHCQRGHPFNSKNTYIRPDNGGRACKRCRAMNQADYRRRKLAERSEAPKC